MDFRGCDTFTEATARFNLSIGCPGLCCDHPGLTKCNFSSVGHIERGSPGFDGHSHCINNHSLFPRSNVFETGWPSLKSFETERE